MSIVLLLFGAMGRLSKLADAKPFYMPHAFQLQADELHMDFERVWHEYFLNEEEQYASFMNHVLKTFCKVPKQLAVEASPFQLLVCVEKCDVSEVAVISIMSSGVRIRECVHK
jgi:hypothetical protein